MYKWQFSGRSTRVAATLSRRTAAKLLAATMLAESLARVGGAAAAGKSWQLFSFSELDIQPGDVINILGVDHVFYEAVMHTGGTLSWNNNNPGNITHFHGEAERYGAYPGKHNDIFAIFPDEATGLQAIVRFIRRREGMTIDSMIRNVYAPAGHGGNDPTVYAQTVANRLGVSPDTVISTLSDDQLFVFANEVKRIEGWREGQVYTPDALPEDVYWWIIERPSREQRALDDQPLAKRGSSGDGVKNIQRLLNDWLFSQGRETLVVDGLFGPATETAAKAFQSAHGLTADGIVGHRTWLALTGQG